MKSALIATLSLAAGFLLSLLLLNPAPIATRPVTKTVAVSPGAVQMPAESEGAEFDFSTFGLREILPQDSVFNQLFVAYRISAVAGAERLKQLTIEAVRDASVMGLIQAGGYKDVDRVLELIAELNGQTCRQSALITMTMAMRMSAEGQSVDDIARTLGLNDQLRANRKVRQS